MESQKPVLELVLFSDMHAHNFRFGAKRVQYDGAMYNSRLIDCVNILKEVETYCTDNEIKYVLFGGDLFHRRSVLHTDAYNLIYKTIADMESLSFVMIPGNHDYADRSGHVHSLEPFDRLMNVQVLDTTAPCRLADSVVIIPVPYTDDPVEAKKRLEVAGNIADLASPDPSILLAHLGMQGAKVGSDYVLVSDSDIGVDDVHYKKFTACFFGHYHQHQQLFPNGYFIGATHHHNWGDANSHRGFIHLKVFSDHIEFTQIETAAPRFLNVNEDTVDSTSMRSGDFIRYHTNDTTGTVDTHALKQKLGVEQVELIEHIKDELEELKLPEKTLEPDALVELWTSKVEDIELRDSLTQLGKQLLREAGSEVL